MTDQKKEVVSQQNIPAPVSFAMNDIDYWRKKNNFPANSKIFMIIGGYVALRKAFLQRGDLYMHISLKFYLTSRLA